VPIGLGPRFLIEAALLIAIAVIAGVERFSTVTIVVMMAVAWAVLAAVECAAWLVTRSRRRRAPTAPLPLPAAQQAPEPSPAPEVAPTPVPEPQPTPEPEPVPEPKPVPDLEPVPEPLPSTPRVAVVSPLPEPEPEPAEPEIEPPPQAQPVFLDARRVDGPREWNLWDLERLARERSGDDVARDEERSYLLVYLREFAGPDGRLPADFDGVVRESFGDVLGAARS
jgi:hypothetical protein